MSKTLKKAIIATTYMKNEHSSTGAFLFIKTELYMSMVDLYGKPRILSLFRNEFNKFNNTRARMLDSIYHMTNTLKSHFWRKNVIILSLCTQRFFCYGRHNVSRKSINH